MNNFNSVVVVDTNILVEDPKAILNFPESLVVIPTIVIEELDGLKNNSDGNVRRTSRMASWLLDEISELNEGEEYMLMENGGLLKIEGNYRNEFECSEPSKPDNIIISVAVGYAKEEKEVTLYSLDTNVRVISRAQAQKYKIPLKARKYMLTDRSLDEINTGVVDMIVSEKLVSTCRTHGNISMELDYINGEHIILRADTNLDNAVLAQYDSIHKTVVALPDYKRGEPLWRIGNNNYGLDNVRPRDSRQTFLAHDILDTSKSLHFVMSRVAGAGKNYITTACALKLLQVGHYDKLIIVKPMYEVDGERTGFLPGTKEEKIAPWFESHSDTMFELTGGRGLDIELGMKIEMDIVTHMRGRSIPRTIMIVDEAQNFSTHALKTLLTRAGEGSKFILMGDLSQIDNPRLDASNCGLRVWSERARKKDVGFEDSTYILLDGNFRSRLSAWSSSFYE